ALDIALHDLWGQRQGLPLWQLWGLDPHAAPATSFTIAIAPVEQMQAHVREAERYPLLKIKLGTDRDLAILEGIRAVTDKPLRVDANAAWTVDEAIEKIRAIEPYGIDLVEQPIPPGDTDGLRRIREAIDVPLLVDESVTDAASIPPLAGAVDGINIKLMKCGGLREARRMIELARSLGLQVMLGCYIESAVSITAAAHLAPLADYADLDGCFLIADDPFQGMTLAPDGRVVPPDGPGLGVRLREA
ncbi:MAG: dipeptide epimerase, partial [Planctomycetota bacterium]